MVREGEWTGERTEDLVWGVVTTVGAGIMTYKVASQLHIAKQNGRIVKTTENVAPKKEFRYDLQMFAEGEGKKKAIVIGENMRKRVEPYANKIGAEVYNGMPGFKKGMETEGLLHNQAFIEQKMREGYKIIDIGPDFERRVRKNWFSPNYQMERRITKDYAGYQKMFIRRGKSLTVIEPRD